MFAETQPTPEAMSQFWMIVVMIVSFASNVVLIVTSIVMVSSNKKQRREVTFGFEPASKADFEAHEEWNRREHENLFSKIGGVERGAQSKLEDAINSGNVSREKLHERINDLLAAISRLQGRLSKGAGED